MKQMGFAIALLSAALALAGSAGAGGAQAGAAREMKAQGGTAMTFAPPSAANLIANVRARKAISLDGQWDYIVDPYEAGLHRKFWEDRKEKDPSELIEYDFDAAGQLQVPGDWNSQKENLLFYEGPVWYRRKFLYHGASGARQFLYFGGANYFTRVYLNGQKLGEHEGGFTPFDFEVTGVVRDGENDLIVEVNNTRRKDGVPTVETDWWNFGGLTRRVELVELPQTFIQDYAVRLQSPSPSGSADAAAPGAEITGWVLLNGSGAAGQNVTVEIPEAKLKTSATTGATGRAEFHVPVTGALELWSPDHPKLYEVSISSVQDRVEDHTGFRTIEAHGTKIYLNGQPIFLRGVSMHEMAPFRDGRAFSAEDDQQLLGWAKELGCNYARLAHYPYNEEMARTADRMGVLLWEEVPVYWGIAWTNEGTFELAEQQMRDLVTRDKNRASVILWSVANETPVVPGRLEFLKHLAAYTRQLDGSRLITAAMNHTGPGPQPGTQTLDDPLPQYLDVAGVNEYMGWYKGAPEDAANTRWEFSFQKPVIFSEFGAGAVYGLHGDEHARWTEEYQARVYRNQIEMLKRVPQLAGMSAWVLMDFSSPERPRAKLQDYHNRKGLISGRGQKKQAFYVLRKFYKDMAAK